VHLSRRTAPEYIHEPPDDLAPALVPSLLAQRVVAGGDQLAATLFELVRRGRYKMTHVTREESSFAGLRHKEVDERLAEPRGLLQCAASPLLPQA
jgi:hypothetical protein